MKKQYIIPGTEVVSTPLSTCICQTSGDVDDDSIHKEDEEEMTKGRSVHHVDMLKQDDWGDIW